MFNRLSQREDSVAESISAWSPSRRAEEELPEAAGMTGTDIRIEEYLEQVCGRLLTLSYTERRHIRDELRSHIEATVDAMTELGDSRAEAVTQALSRLGKPEKVARSFVTAYLSSGQSRLASPGASFGRGMQVYATAGLLMIAFVLALTSLATTPYAPGFVKTFAHNGLWAFITMLVPAAAGWYMGADARTPRPGFGSFLALASLCGLSLPLVILLFIGNSGPLTLFGLMNFIFFCWMPTATISATLSQAYTRRWGRLKTA